MRTDFFLYIFVLRVASGPRVKLPSFKKCLKSPGGLVTVLSGGPSVSLSFCCYVVYSTRRFVLCLTLCHFFLCFSVHLALRLPRLGKRELILVFFVHLCLLDFSVSSSSWCLGRAEVCNCGTPWTFLLPFFFFVDKKLKSF